MRIVFPLVRLGAATLYFALLSQTQTTPAAGQKTGSKPEDPPASITLTAEEKNEVKMLELEKENLDLKAQNVLSQIQQARVQIENERKNLESKLLAAHSLKPGEYHLDERSGQLDKSPTPKTPDAPSRSPVPERKQ